MPAEFFFFWHELVDGVVAVSAKRNRFSHLLAGEILLEPLVAVTSPRNQMVFGGSGFRRSFAE